MTDRHRPKRPWRGIFNNKNELVGMAEEQHDGWHVFVDQRDVGVITSPEMAKELIERVNRGGVK
jgi:hypothetical protein